PRELLRWEDSLGTVSAPVTREFLRWEDSLGMLNFPIVPWFGDLLAAMQRWRRDHRDLSDQARQEFNDAIQQAHSDGTYQDLAAVHADMTHRMHTQMGATISPVGAQRFLPWHRIFT